MKNHSILEWADAWSDEDVRHNYLWIRDALIVSRQHHKVTKYQQASYAIIRAIMQDRGISTKYWSKIAKGTLLVWEYGIFDLDSGLMKLNSEGIEQVKEGLENNETESHILYELFEELMCNGDFCFSDDFACYGGDVIHFGYYNDYGDEFTFVEDTYLYVDNNYAIRGLVENHLQYGKFTWDKIKQERE